jgi:hypothetical protein
VKLTKNKNILILITERFSLNAKCHTTRSCVGRGQKPSLKQNQTKVPNKMKRNWFKPPLATMMIEGTTNRILAKLWLEKNSKNMNFPEELFRIELFLHYMKNISVILLIILIASIYFEYKEAIMISSYLFPVFLGSTVMIINSAGSVRDYRSFLKDSRELSERIIPSIKHIHSKEQLCDRCDQQLKERAYIVVCKERIDGRLSEATDGARTRMWGRKMGKRTRQFKISNR